MNKLKVLLLGMIVSAGSLSLVMAQGSLEPGEGSISPECNTYCTPSDRFNCRIVQTHSEITCFEKKVKAEYGGVN